MTEERCVAVIALKQSDKLVHIVTNNSNSAPVHLHDNLDGFHLHKEKGLKNIVIAERSLKRLSGFYLRLQLAEAAADEKMKLKTFPVCRCHACDELQGSK